MRRRVHRCRIDPTTSVVGLDLSLRAAAACALPFPWDLDLAKVRMMRTGSSLKLDATPKEHAERNAQIAHDVCVFCVNVRMKHLAVEEYAFSASGARARAIAEMVGVVKHEVLEMFDMGLPPIPPATARKVLLQKLPRADVKEFTYRNVRRLGGPALEWTEDEVDAFVIANTVLMHAGGTAMTFPGE